MIKGWSAIILFGILICFLTHSQNLIIEIYFKWILISIIFVVKMKDILKAL